MCPWSSFEAGSIAFCEARECAWVVEPSNAWSSVGYVLVGLWVWRRSAHALARHVALAAVLIGLGSFAFHATGTFVGELVDLTGMLLLSGLMLSQAWGRAVGLAPRAVAWRWAALTVGALALVLVIKPAGIPLFAAQTLTAVGLELALWRRGQTARLRPFVQALAMTSTAFAVWALDVTHLVCAPDNHLVTGHAVWHVLNALALSRLAAFYEDRVVSPDERALPRGEPEGV
jgi:hypothetical protein